MREEPCERVTMMCPINRMLCGADSRKQKPIEFVFQVWTQHKSVEP
jgi:hypothetical protein